MDARLNKAESMQQRALMHFTQIARAVQRGNLTSVESWVRQRIKSLQRTGG